MDLSLRYATDWKVLVCNVCGSAVPPESTAIERHLRNAPHLLKGIRLKTALTAASLHQLAPLADVGWPENGIRALAGLAVRNGVECLACQSQRPYQTVDSKAMQRHISREHGIKPRTQLERTHWRRCHLQTFFAETRHIRYFRVVMEEEEEEENDEVRSGGSGGDDGDDGDDSDDGDDGDDGDAGNWVPPVGLLCSVR